MATVDTALVPVEEIERAILLIRGQKVILDQDLAAFYGVETKRLNEQVRRNIDRFPSDFMFQLTWDEVIGMRSQIATLNASGQGSRSQTATLKRGSNVKYAPNAFTEHGAIMVAAVLNSPRAVEMSVYVVRAFVRMRQFIASQKALAAKFAELERKLTTHDKQIQSIVDAIRELMVPVSPKGRLIGFRPVPEGGKPTKAR